MCDFREEFTEGPQRKDTDVFDNNNLKHLFIKTQSKKYKPQNVKKIFLTASLSKNLYPDYTRNYKLIKSWTNQ